MSASIWNVLLLIGALNESMARTYKSDQWDLGSSLREQKRKLGPRPMYLL